VGKAIQSFRPPRFFFGPPDFLIMKTFLFTFFLSLLTIAPASAQHRLNDLLPLFNLPLGQDKAATLMVLQTRFSRDIMVQIRATNDPVRKAQLRRVEQERLRKLASASTDTSEHKGIFRLSPIAGFVAVGPGSSVLEEETRGSKRWLLFFNDRLYGVALRLDVKGKFPDQVSLINSAFGKPDSFIRLKGSNKVLGASWKQNDWLYLLRNFETEFGILLMVQLDLRAWDHVQKVTKQNLGPGPQDKMSAEKLLEDILE